MELRRAALAAFTARQPLEKVQAVQALWAQGERSLLRTLRSLQAVALPWPEAADFANLNHLAAGQP